MAQPTPYTRLYNFTDFQTVNPTSPLPATQVDNELNAVALTVGQIRGNLGQIQRDDGALANQSVTPDSLSAGVIAMISQGEYTPRGAWAATTAYAVGDVVTFNAATYLALASHTAAAAFATDLAAGRWLLIANGALSGAASAVDLFSGTGSQTVFTLSFSYNGSNAAVVYVGGVAQVPVQDFTISGTTLTFLSAPPAPAVPGRSNIMVRGTGVEAQLAADVATTQAANAANSASAAATSATNANTSRTQAATSATNAAASATNAATSATTATTQATTATTQATNASTSATNAANSASAAATSATSASTSASNALTSATTATLQATTATSQATAAGNSATAAQNSANAAATSASTASGAATTATNQASAASTSATAASTSASNAAASASTASTSASNASSSASSASTSASSASTSATNAAASATAAAASATSASNSASSASTSATNAASSAATAVRYLGPSNTNPSTRPDASALQSGDLYFNTTANEMRVFNGTTWQQASAIPDTLTERSFAATAGQTSYTFVGGYRVGYTFVWVNGLLLDGSDITASNGTTITFGTPLSAGDEVRMLSFKAVGSVTAVDVGALPTAGGTMTGSLNFSGNGLRITGDFSNATIANRVMFQTSTVNGNTALGVIPNGTATFSGVNVYQSSDPANSAIGDLSISGSGGFVRLRSIATGTGTTLPMIFDVGNSERMRVDTSGNVGIGTSTPASNLDVSGGASVATVRVRQTSTSGAAEVRFGDNAGNDGGLIIKGGSTYASYGGSNSFMFWNNRSGPVVFGTNDTERARISAAGGFSVGTTSDPGAGAINATGNITAFFSSDRTLKENIRDIPDALNKACAIGGKLFDWTDAYIEKHGGADGYFVQKADFGVIAQDVQEQLPVAVRTRDDGALAVDYEKMCALAFAAIAELRAEVEALKKGL